MSNDTVVAIIDWGGWFVSNVLVGALAPLGAMAVMHFLRAIIDGHYNIDYFAPFRDGQLGFVAVGWVVGALVELLKYAVKRPELWELFTCLILMVLAGFGALIAAAGSVAPVQPPTNPPATRRAWMRTYLA